MNFSERNKAFVGAICARLFMPSELYVGDASLEVEPSDPASLVAELVRISAVPQ